MYQEYWFKAVSQLSSLPLAPLSLYRSEITVDDTPAIEEVLKADVKRLRLLEEEKSLIAASEKGDDSKSDRLREVSPTSQTYCGV